MDCKTATKVYLAGNPLSKIQELFPGARPLSDADVTKAPY